MDTFGRDHPEVLAGFVFLQGVYVYFVLKPVASLPCSTMASKTYFHILLMNMYFVIFKEKIISI